VNGFAKCLRFGSFEGEILAKLFDVTPEIAEAGRRARMRISTDPRPHQPQQRRELSGCTLSEPDALEELFRKRHRRAA
jgi:hypothetical protein